MAERRVRVKLVADVSEYTAGLAKAATQTRALGADVEKSMDRDFAPRMQRSGERSGGLLARGINNGLVRNSPVIAAGVSAALAAGAPAALAGATVLFAGIGGIAAAQTTRVKTAWTELGHNIRDGAIQDAAVLVPVYEQMAEKIGASFETMRPQIREAFEASAPLIDSFTDSLTQAAENALPGLVRAVQSGGPVIEGLGSLMEDIGTGLSDFLDAMSDNSGAAGRALELIGEALAEALPLLGELLGTGAELATLVLPPLVTALGAVRNIADALGPILPAVVAGFAGFKVASSLTGPIKTLAQNLAEMSYSSSALAGTAGQASTAVSTLGRALPLIGTVLSLFAVGMERAEEQSRQWAEALAAGGAVADRARAQMSDFHVAMETTNSGFTGFMTGLLGVGSQAGLTVQAIKGAEDGTRDLGTAATVVREPIQTLETRLDELRTKADESSDAVDDLKLSLDILTGANMTTMQATAALEAALDAGIGALDGLDGSAQNAAGGIDLTSEAGRRSFEVLTDVKDAGNTLIATMIQQGATAEDVARADATLRANFVKTAQQMGFSAEEANNLADQILGIPTSRTTTIVADTRTASTAVAAFQRQIDGLHGKTVDIQANWANGGSLNGSMRFDFAQGGVVDYFANGGFSENHVAQIAPAGAMRLWAEPETGGEAYIPLAPAKRSRSLAIWEETGRRLNAYADGGISSSPNHPINVRANFAPIAEFARTAAGQIRKLLEPATGMVGALNWARTQVGRPYIWGGVGPAGYDCSGFMSAITNVIRGRNPYARVGATSTFPWSGFAPGYGSFTIGSTPNAGGGIGHMAGTLLGVNVESAGGVGVRMGSSARGASNGLFSTRAHLAMANGGIIGEPVVGIGARSGNSYSFGERGPETVTPGIRSREFSGGSVAGWAGGGSSPRTVIYDQRQVHAEVDARRLSQQMAADQRVVEFLHG